ncbi:DUF2635 domain-containing protein [Tianweitania sp. BSSL-BM11]|uniref:DUF2635 domain-containing protein n=1 Tax=Tianweitania aestuarii TaxID=2814886 RepID=A0ABS5RWW9_9HYPH|nr:DUF2635 domain-containing protein [Tianweitania aestuarii]MBS9720177.1 DUF2635 domain-containing protein [Tianweitania aestuarii]
MSKRYRAKRGQLVPIPGQPNQYVPDEGDGIPVSETLPYWARLIADGDLVEVPATKTEEPKPERNK